MLFSRFVASVDYGYKEEGMEMKCIKTILNIVYLSLLFFPASFGGLMSLMLGFTLISGFDLMIFFAFRVVYDAFRLIMKVPRNKGNKKFTKKINKVHNVEVLQSSHVYMTNQWVNNSLITRKRKKFQWSQPPQYEDTERY